MHVLISFRLSCRSPNASCSTTSTIALRAQSKSQCLVSASTSLPSILLGTPFNNCINDNDNGMVALVQPKWQWQCYITITTTASMTTTTAQWHLCHQNGNDDATSPPPLCQWWCITTPTTTTASTTMTMAWWHSCHQNGDDDTTSLLELLVPTRCRGNSKGMNQWGRILTWCLILLQIDWGAITQLLGVESLVFRVIRTQLLYIQSIVCTSGWNYQ